MILGAVAAGANPAHFGGNGKSNDLVARLEATEKLTGSSVGAFGTAPLLNSVLYQALSLSRWWL